LGTTPQTSSIYKTYSSIALQLHYILNLMTANDRTFSKNNYNLYARCNDIVALREFILHELSEINKLDPQKTVIFLLDSLDQLNPNDFKHVDKWLLTDLPHYVKFIVSTIPDHGNLLQLITKLIRKKFDEQLKLKLIHLIDDDASSYEDKLNKLIMKQTLQVTELSPEESETILTKWLVKGNRRLTDEQWHDLRSIFKNGKLLLLFLKLTYDVVHKWHSWSRADSEFLTCSKIEDIIIYMFKKLETMHGEVIFRRAVCYMTVNKNGISDNELEDILSLDDDVLYAAFQFHLPPIRRFPTILWVRIKKDIEQYIVEKEANDTKVIQWHHRKFIEVSLNHYVKKLSAQENETVSRNILDFYNETWKGNL
jgi:hypothetical protein